MHALYPSLFLTVKAKPFISRRKQKAPSPVKERDDGATGARQADRKLPNVIDRAQTWRRLYMYHQSAALCSDLINIAHR
ncbi:hypothetical protein EVAR_82737_1 [Eumeta japonica]|uniref:Uncharacterized protein n=1 Tax=Eumeta variegata TaxID=151549 RepID=A0A4C1ZIF9_EUMVA|nr:hypothetical protein EVAR_82737_1 [Eumeta japonica]